MADYINDAIEYKFQSANGEEQILNIFKFDTKRIARALA